MIKYDLILSRECGYSTAKVEENKRGSFYKVEEVDEKIKQLEERISYLENIEN